MLKSAAAIVRAYIMYKPYVIFGWVSASSPSSAWCRSCGTPCSSPSGEGGGHLQSLILGAVLLISSFLCVMLGIISDLIRTNRILIEANLEHTKRARFEVERADGDDGAPRMRVVGS